MTEPRKWPTVAADDRDKAAELVNDAALDLEKLHDRVPPEIRDQIGQNVIRLQKSLRLLEKHGAQTRVPA